MEILAVFKNRSETLKFYKLLLRLGGSGSIVNTPSGLRQGCGISVAIGAQDQIKAKAIIKENLFPSFLGFFRR
ncbi:MAG: DUF3343 domain-containing protein [Christensenellales bacterium]|jgi:hypothetical protein